MEKNDVQLHGQHTGLVGALPHEIISECVNSMLKRKMPTKIRKKLPQRKRTEEFLKVNMHNLGKYNYLRHTKGEMIGDYYKKKYAK